MFNHLNFLSSLQLTDSFRNPGRIDTKLNDNFLLSSQFQIAYSQTYTDILKLYPKDFKITNQGKDYFVASPFIRDLSITINKLPPQVNEFSLDIKDPFDSLQKFLNVFSGEVITIDIKQERSFFKKFSSVLQINLPPPISYVSGYQGANYQAYQYKTLKMYIVPYSVQNLAQKNLKKFTIKTNAKSYTCNYLAVVLSETILSALNENPNLEEYFYEIDDQENQFQIFSDFFNFNCCQITSQNLDFIEKVSADLGISYIQSRIAEYKKKFEDGQKILDVEQDQIELVTSLQEQLFNLTEKNFDTTFESLSKSIWLNDSERIKEFSSNLAIVATYRPENYQVLIKLIKQISEKFPTFLPFFNPYIMFLSSNSLGSFIYLMYKAELISLDLILENLRENIIFNPVEDRSSISTQLILWFLPEFDSRFPYIIENISFIGNLLIIRPYLERNLDLYKANDWKVYKEMRENIYNSDPFAKAIVADDIDTFQELVSSIQFDMSHQIQPSIFENFEPIEIIDYAALHSSLACFKFMMLNHAKITSNTVANAIKGGNTEIIRVSEMSKTDDWQSSLLNNGPNFGFGRNNFGFAARWGGINNNNNIFISDNSPGLNIFKQAVSYHRYGIFEWLMQTITDQSLLIKILQNCMLTVILTNNIMSLMSIIDSGVNLSSKNPSLNNNLRANSISAASRGYSDLLKIILSLTDKSIFIPQSMQNQGPTFCGFNSKQATNPPNMETVLVAASSFGSVRIIKMMIASRIDDPITSDEIESSLIAAASRGHLDVIKLWIEVLHPTKIPEILPSTENDEDNEEEDFIFDTEYSFNKAVLKYSKSKIEIPPKSYTKFLQKATYFGHIDILKYFIDKEDCDWISILESAAQHGQLSIIEYLIDTKFKNKGEPILFNKAFCLAAQNGFFDVCNYFAEKSYIELASSLINDILGEIASKGYIDILQLIFKILPKTESSSQMNVKCLNSAIENGQVKVASLFIKLGCAENNTLIKASKKGLLDIVKLLCENPDLQNNDNNSDLYINYTTMIEGSALCAAAYSGSSETVDYLLKQPGINLNLYNSSHDTAIIIAAKYKHFQIMKNIISAYSEDEIQKEIWQINIAFVSLFQPKQAENANTYSTGFSFAARAVPHNQLGTPVKSTPEPEKIEFDYDMLNYFLCFKEVDPNYLYDNKTPFIAAIMNNNYECVDAMLTRPEIDVNFKDANGRTPLMIAVQYSNAKIVELLINDDRIDINYMNSNNESALSLSTSSHNFNDKILTAITKSPRFQEDTINTNYAVSNSSSFGQRTAFSTLMRLNFDVNRKYDISKFSKTTILESVCSCGNDVNNNVPLVLNHPRFDPVRNDLVNCIFSICRYNELQPFNLLLGLLNGNVNQKDSSGSTLLVEAVKSRTDVILQIIVGSPAFDPVLSDVKTAFAFSLCIDNMLTGLLIDQPGIDINEHIYLHYPFNSNYLNYNNYNPNYFSAGVDGTNDNPFEWNKREIVYVNDNYNEQYNNQFFISDGFTPLAVAVNNPSILELLLSRENIDVNKKCIDGSAPIFEAMRSQNSLSFETLIKRDDIDLNITNRNGMTPLIYAMSNLMNIYVSLLLTKENIDLSIKDNFGKTAFDYFLEKFNINPNLITEPKTSKEFAKLFDVACIIDDFDNY